MISLAAGSAELESLERFLGEDGLCDGPVEARRIGDGHSNLPYHVSDGDRGVVAGRPPPPPVPRGAHDVLREARVISVLHGSGVPVARVLAVAQAGEVFADAPCYVMEHVDGEVMTDGTT